MMKPCRINSASSVACLVVAALLCGQPTRVAAAVEGSFQRTLQVSGAVNLDVTTGSGSIQVHTGNSNQVQVTGHIKATEWFGDAEAKVKRLEDNPPVQQSGNDIRVGHIDDPDLRHNISISYEIAVPAETQLRAHSGSGNQSVEGISGPLQVDTGSGELKISDVGAHVQANTGSGSIVIDRVKGDVHAKAGSGSIRATEIAVALKQTPAAVTFPWNSRPRDRCEQRRAPEAWSCTAFAVHWRPRRAVERFEPMVALRAPGMCALDRAPYN
jgi:hypothetical protein